MQSIALTLQNTEVLALTIWSEAKRSSIKDMYSVGSVVINRFNLSRRNFGPVSTRTHHTYADLRAVVTEKGQFQAWRNRGVALRKVKTLDKKCPDYLAYLTARLVANDLIVNGPRIRATAFNSHSGRNVYTQTWK